MEIIVTGGKGFIGSATARELERQGHEPIILDRDRDILDGIDEEADGVIHLAGMLGTSELFEDFDRAVDVNVKGVHRALEFCREREIPYVGITMPAVWANVYQATKRCANILATAWHESYGVPVSHVRAFNGFGSDQKYGYGHPQKIIPTFSSLAWDNEPIPIWGDGLQTVDLIHVDQIARCLVDALSFGDDQTIDAGSGVEMTVLEVAEMVLELTGSEGGIEHLPMRAGEREHTFLCAKGEGWDLLNWQPNLDIDQLAETIRSYEP